MSTEGNDHKQVAYDFISTNRLAALATTDNKGVPHVAPVYCVVDIELNIYFSTRIEGRKFVNLEECPIVAMTFIDEKNIATIQLTGSSERIQDMEIEQSVMRDLARLRYQDPNWPVPTLRLFDKGYTNELAIIKVIPAEMTFANFATSKTGKCKPFFQKII